MNGPVTLINALSVPPEESERSLRRWKDGARIMIHRPGLIGAPMYRSLVDDAELRFVNVAEWTSRELLDEATANLEFHASVQWMLDDPDLHLTARPVVHRSPSPSTSARSCHERGARGPHPVRRLPGCARSLTGRPTCGSPLSSASAA
jgi:heme-degrading monooxygenase HmoA